MRERRAGEQFDQNNKSHVDLKRVLPNGAPRTGMGSGDFAQLEAALHDAATGRLPRNPERFRSDLFKLAYGFQKKGSELGGILSLRKGDVLFGPGSATAMMLNDSLQRAPKVRAFVISAAGEVSKGGTDRLVMGTVQSVAENCLPRSGDIKNSVRQEVLKLAEGTPAAKRIEALISQQAHESGSTNAASKTGGHFSRIEIVKADGLKKKVESRGTYTTVTRTDFRKDEQEEEMEKNRKTAIENEIQDTMTAIKYKIGHVSRLHASALARLMEAAKIEEAVGKLGARPYWKRNPGWIHMEVTNLGDLYRQRRADYSRVRGNIEVERKRLLAHLAKWEGLQSMAGDSPKKYHSNDFRSLISNSGAWAGTVGAEIRRTQDMIAALDNRKNNSLTRKFDRNRSYLDNLAASQVTELVRGKKDSIGDKEGRTIASLSRDTLLEIYDTYFGDGSAHDDWDMRLGGPKVRIQVAERVKDAVRDHIESMSDLFKTKGEGPSAFEEVDPWQRPDRLDRHGPFTQAKFKDWGTPYYNGSNFPATRFERVGAGTFTYVDDLTGKKVEEQRQIVRDSTGLVDPHRQLNWVTDKYLREEEDRVGHFTIVGPNGERLPKPKELMTAVEIANNDPSWKPQAWEWYTMQLPTSWKRALGTLEQIQKANSYLGVREGVLSLHRFFREHPTEHWPIQAQPLVQHIAREAFFAASTFADPHLEFEQNRDGSPIIPTDPNQISKTLTTWVNRIKDDQMSTRDFWDQWYDTTGRNSQSRKDLRMGGSRALSVIGKVETAKTETYDFHGAESARGDDLEDRGHSSVDQQIDKMSTRKWKDESGK